MRELQSRPRPLKGGARESKDIGAGQEEVREDAVF
jgi:hypothetical protein